jgi:hypothetical protein
MLNQSDSERAAGSVTLKLETLHIPVMFGTRLRMWLLFVSITLAVGVTAGLALGGIFSAPDANWYLLIAQGQTREVLQPFASRQLGPLIVRGITHLARASVESGFMIEGAISMLIAVASVGYLLIRSGANWFILLPISLIPFWANLFNGLVLPDLLYAALTGCFLVLLWKDRFLAASLMLLPMEVCREATMLALLCFIVAGWRRIRLIHAGVAFAATYAGIRVVSLLDKQALSNHEQMSDFPYMAGKLAWNFSKNVVGFPLWSDLNQPCDLPAWQTKIHIGGMHAIGVCSFSPARPIWTASMALATFGLFPLLLFYIWQRQGPAIYNRSLLMRFCIVYGAASILLAPMLGALVPRLIAYAWPLFLVAVPILSHECIRIRSRAFVALLSIHLALAWLTVVDHSTPLPLGSQAGMLLVCVLGYVLGWLLIARQASMATPVAPAGPSHLASS